MTFRLSSLALCALVLAVVSAECSCNGDCSDTPCPSPPYQEIVVTFACGKRAPATLTANGACELGFALEGAPSVTFVTDGVCHLSATYADGTTAEADVSRTPVQSCCSGQNYSLPSYSGLQYSENIGPAEVQLGGPPCGDAGFGTGYAGYEQDGGSPDASDGEVPE